jgi:GH15 family glucan-1,4-alpha-glucosidase
LQFLDGHDGDEHNAHQDVITITTNTMMILILMIFTYSRSDNKIKLIMSENNTNKNSMDNLIQQNINCHSQCDDQIHYYKHECFN